MRIQSVSFVALDIILSLTIVILLFGCSDVNSPDQKKEEKYINPDPWEQNKTIARSVNLGNMLEAPNEGDWGITVDELFFELIGNAGFNAVRVPIRWSTHALADSPWTINTFFFDRIDWVVDKARMNNLSIIINIHHYEEIMTDPAAHHARFLGLWKQISEHYADEPLDLFFEILNEPNDKLTPQLWNTYLADAIEIIRQTNPDRTLIVGTANWGGLDGLGDLTIPDDDYLIVTYHYYSPFEFTHQGAEWVSGSDSWLGTTWRALGNEKAAVMADFDKAIAWSQQHNTPIFMGEFGAYSRADITSRVAWTNFVAREAEKRAFSWAYWEFCSGFGVYDLTNSQWKTDLLKALIPPE